MKRRVKLGDQCKVQIHPWNLLSGLGTMDRKDLCNILAMFQNSSLLNLAKDRLEDANPFSSDGEEPRLSTFQRRLERTSAALACSKRDDGALRLMVWGEIQKALGCPPSLPLSLRSSSTAAADIAQRAAKILSGITGEENSKDMGWRDKASSAVQKAKLAFRSANSPEFEEIVTAQASRLMVEALKEDLVDQTQKKEIVKEFRRRLEKLPPEMQTEEIQRAIESGDAASLRIVAGTGALIGVGMAVQASGFGAYILAAQASAFIPLIGGKAAISALFVLANPLFIVSAVLAGSWLVGGQLEDAIKRRLAAGLTVLLTLRGICIGKSGIQLTLDGFKNAKWHNALSSDLSYFNHLAKVQSVIGGKIPLSPGDPPGFLSRAVGAGSQPDIERLLFPDCSKTHDVAGVTVLTLGEVIYSAASVDPKVVAAADFSRIEDLSDLLSFGAFADRIGAISGSALMGAENNLRGYVAEQIVAARLVENGHQVCFPESSNQAGYDLLVDGSEFQVKCLLDVSGLAEHCSKYPETAVFANAELAEKIVDSEVPWHGQVFFLEGYDYGTTDNLLHDSLEAGRELTDLDVPFFAVAVSAAKNLRGWWKGDVPLADIPFEVAVDGAINGTLAVAGGLSGKALGLLLFGPAGALVFGGVGGVVSLFGVARVRTLVDKKLNPEWTANVDQASKHLVEAIDCVVSKKKTLLDEKLAVIAEDPRPEVKWIRSRMQDDQVFLAEASVRIDEIRRDRESEHRALSALRAIHDFAVHPRTVHVQMTNLLRTLAARPSVGDRARDAWSGVVSIKKRFQTPGVFRSSRTDH